MVDDVGVTKSEMVTRDELEVRSFVAVTWLCISIFTFMQSTFVHFTFMQFTFHVSHQASAQVG